MAQVPPERPPLHIGDRNDDRRARPNPPRGAGLTEPPVHELAIPHEVTDPATGVLTGSELWDKRRKRPTEERLDHADARMDKLMNELIESRVFFRTFTLKMLGIIGLVVAAYLYGRHG